MFITSMTSERKRERFRKRKVRNRPCAGKRRSNLAAKVLKVSWFCTRVQCSNNVVEDIRESVKSSHK